jgi:excisionase family DNA binding protein
MNLYSNAKNVCRDDARSESVHRDLPHRLMSVQEAANFLGLSVSTLNKMRLSGNGPPYMKLGRRVLYDPRDLEAWSAERRRSHTSDY